MEYNGQIMNSNDYIDTICKDSEWMGELEISALSIIYNVNIILFRKNFNNEIDIINKYGDFNDNDKLLFTLYYINDNHFNVLYKNDISVDNLFNNIYLKEKNIITSTKNNNNEIKFKYDDEKKR